MYCDVGSPCLYLRQKGFILSKQLVTQGIEINDYSAYFPFHLILIEIVDFVQYIKQSTGLGNNCCVRTFQIRVHLCMYRMRNKKNQVHALAQLYSFDAVFNVVSIMVTSLRFIIFNPVNRHTCCRLHNRLVCYCGYYSYKIFSSIKK